MQDCVADTLPSVLCVNFVTGDVLIAISDAPNIFHSTHFVVRAKDLIELVKGIGAAKHLFIKGDTFLRDSEPVVLNLFTILGQRLAAVEFH